jgi:hypothetical protein
MIEDRNKEIAKLWETGYTSGEIARKLEISRGSVMGVIHRFRANGEKISRRAKPKFAIEPPKKEVAPVVKKSTKSVKAKPPKPLKPLPLFETPAPVLLNANCTFMDLTPQSCRFIIGPVRGLDTIYCGEPKSGRSFCKQHKKLCYYTIQPKPNLNKTEPKTPKL